MVLFPLYKNILSSDITPTKTDAETFSTEHEPDKKKNPTQFENFTCARVATQEAFPV